MRLPRMAEPLVIDPAMDADDEMECYATRQMRRRAKRAEAKASRRRGEPVARAVVAEVAEKAIDIPAPCEEAALDAPIEEIAQAPVDTTIDSLAEPLAKVRAELPPIAEPKPAAEPASIAEAAPLQAAETAPLPSNRALTKRPSGLLARLFGGWWRKSTRLERRDTDPMTEQMLVLRTELALVQMRLDRMIKAASA